MNLVIFSHKRVWDCPESPTGFATDGGFAFQVEIISQLFESTTLFVPKIPSKKNSGDIYIIGKNLKIKILKDIKFHDFKRKLLLPLWIISNFSIIRSAIKQADAVHLPLPSDFGLVALFIAISLKKPLFIRHCGNWMVQRSGVERFLKAYLEKISSNKRNVILATGGSSLPPSPKYPNIKWIFSTSLRAFEVEELCKNRSKMDPLTPRLILTGRQEKGKGTDKVLESIKELKRDIPLIHFDVVGDGTYLEYLIDKAKEFEIQENVTFHFKVNHNQVLHLLSKSNIFIFPTASEGFSKSLLEAMATGLLVVATPVSVIPFLLSNGAGILLENDAPETITKTIKLLLENNENNLATQKKAQEAVKNYTLENWGVTIKSHLKNAWPFFN
jgi:glycosyltransferase involved in cell wall biosynthesis